MKNTLVFSTITFFFAGLVSADTFGTGANQFEIELVTISGDANSVNGTCIGPEKPEGFIDPGYDYRIGKYEITNDQWNKFQAAYGTLAGSPAEAYDNDSSFTDPNVPTNEVSWHEAAQFVNWLNTSTGYSPAYKFTGTQGTSDYTLSVWAIGDSGYDASNPTRNSNAHYFLPTDDEWVKAAYWNGTILQEYANASPDDLVSGSPDPEKWNYSQNEPWNVGSGMEELNGTYDMMGNIFEWTDTPFYGNHIPETNRVIRGGSWAGSAYWLGLGCSHRGYSYPEYEYNYHGFRVASIITGDCPSADITGDCFVDLEDLAKLVSQWLTGRREGQY